MSYSLNATHQYEKDVKAAKKRGLNVQKLIDVVELLVKDEKLPVSLHDHPLVGNCKGCRECHVSPDWLLVYQKDTIIKLITLVRTGSHSDLF